MGTPSWTDTTTADGHIAARSLHQKSCRTNHWRHQGNPKNRLSIVWISSASSCRLPSRSLPSDNSVRSSAPWFSCKCEMERSSKWNVFEKKNANSESAFKSIFSSAPLFRRVYVTPPSIRRRLNYVRGTWNWVSKSFLDAFSMHLCIALLPHSGEMRTQHLACKFSLFLWWG